MARREPANLELTCPCCGAMLTIDRDLDKVIAHQAPPHRIDAPDFAQANEVLARQKAQREAIFNQSAMDEKVKSTLLERKFEEALKKTKDAPITRPLRDFDLD